MIAQQPLDQLPRLTDPDLHGAWLNKMTKGGRDYGPDGYNMEYAGHPTDERVGMLFDGGTDFLYEVVANWRSTDVLGSFSAWIKLDTIGVNPNIVFGTGDNGSATRYFQIAVLATGQLVVGVRNNDVEDQVYGNTVLVVDTWYHVAITSDGTTSKLYVNGVEDTPYTVPSGANAGRWVGDVSVRDNITIGALWTDGINHPLYGTIKDVRYHSRVLTADEIMYDYRAGVPDDSLTLLIHDGISDRSRFEHALTRFGEIVVGHDMDFDGVDDRIDAGDIGNLQAISTWINPDTTTEQILQIDANKYIHLVAGTVTYVGIVPVATYVNAVVSTTLAADRWQHLVCVFDVDAAANYELGWDGAAYGDILLRDHKAFSEPKSAGWVKVEYDKTKIFY